VPPVRLLTLTSLFPNARQPRHGIFIANRLRRLCDTGRVTATVVAAIPRFPGAYRDSARVPEAESIEGIEVAHPRYFHVPGIGMHVQADFLASALIKHLKSADSARGYDVVDAHYFYPDGVAAAQVADAFGLPLVVSARGSDINLLADDALVRARMLRAARRAQALIAVSGALKASMERMGMPPGRISVLRNGVDPAMFAPLPRSEARARIGVDPRDPLVIAVGNIVPEKGFDLLVRTLGLLPDVRALIIGEGRSERQVRALAEDVAPGRIAFRPSMPQAELRFAYAAANVLALPSLREGWPNVVLESLACGTPVIAARVGGVPEIIDDASAGVIVDDRAPNAWAEAIRRLLQSPPAPGEVRAHASKFGWDEVVRRQCGLYEDVAARWRSAVGPADSPRERAA
jgi:glycosyltransferase involved in cell wall biosynthesis